MTFLVVLGLGACDTSDAPDAGHAVVATTSVLGDVAAHIVGDAGTVEVLMGPGIDPHDFSPSAEQTARLLEADLVVANGLGLEEGFASVLEAAAADGARVLQVASDVRPLGGDGDLDPHFWFDPLRMAEAVDLIADALETSGWPDGVGTAAADYRAQIEETDALVESILDAVPAERRVLVTNHDNLQYFADRYGFEVAGTIIPGASTLAEPSPADLARLVEILRQRNISAIFTDAAGSDRLARALSDEVGDTVTVHRLHTDALGEPGSGADTYLGMLESNARIVAEALG